ncbi:hypothetical protein IQ266_10105 [filamentous cyanobacterium LEGE 11480]|uniref:Uncharacterized protein n=1 Tax=Romeriopsis navalis LEGE 11480 TaxID=2777977 RepID=A0A928Z4B2_9CYAN|nr:hypothetical protein [Romeriopsis navalis]MBE9030080.1 hypothetical protein [Romeriopsis navalis LEGE 11480]
MKLPWQPKDYLFSLCMTIGMIITGFIVPRLTPAKLEIMGWAPFGALFLTLGMAKLKHRGSILLLILPLILIILPRSILIAGYLSLTVGFTELVGLRQNGYRTPRTRAFTIVTFFISSTLLAVISAGLFLGGKWLALLQNPLLVGGMAIGAAVVGIIGWTIGEMLWKKLANA